MDIPTEQLKPPVSPYASFFSLSLCVPISRLQFFSFSNGERTDHSYTCSCRQDLSMDDFERVLLSAKPSVGPDDLKRQVEWTQQFGQEGV